MNRLSAPLAAVLGLGLAAVAWAEEKTPPQDDGPKLNFEDHVLPVFRTHCLGCHNSDAKKGDLDLSSFNGLMAGGSAGDEVEAGEPDSSYLIMLVTHEESPKMPPGGQKIPQKDIDILKAWIAQGLVERAGGKAKTSDKPKANLALTDVPLGKPAGEPATPESVLLQPSVVPERPVTVRALAYSPWAPVLAVAGVRQVLLYDTDTFELTGVLPFPEGFVNVVRFSRNGNLLLAAGGRPGAGGAAALFDVKTGERLTTVGAGTEFDAILAADVSADQSMIAVGGTAKLVKIYSTATGEVLNTIKKHTDWVMSVQFSPDGVLLATGDRSGGLHVWEAYTAQPFFTLNGHKDSVSALSWRIDSNLMASGSEDGNVKLWEMTGGNEVKSFGAHGGGVLDVSYTMDGNLVTAGRDNTVKLFDGNGKGLRTFPGFGDLALKAVPDHASAKVFGADWTGRLVAWNLADGTPLAELATNPAKLQDRLAGVQAELATLETRQAELDANVAQAAERQKAVAAELTKRQQAVKDRQAAKQAAEAALAAANQSKTEAAAALAAMQAQVAAAKQTAEATAKEGEALQAALAAAKADMETAAAQLADATKLLDSLAAVAAQAGQLAEGDLPNFGAPDVAAKSEVARAAAEETVNQVQSQQARMAEAYAKAEAAVAQWQPKKAAAEEQLASLTGQMGAMPAQVAKADAAIQSATTAVKSEAEGMQAAEKAVADYSGEPKKVEDSLAQVTKAAADHQPAVAATRLRKAKLEAGLVQVEWKQAEEAQRQFAAEHEQLVAAAKQAEEQIAQTAAAMKAGQQRMADLPKAMAEAAAVRDAAKQAVQAAAQAAAAAEQAVARQQELSQTVGIQLAQYAAADKTPQVSEKARGLLVQAVGQFEADAKDAETRYAAARQTAEQAAAALKDVEAKLAALDAEKTGLPAKLVEMQTSVAALEQQAAAARQQVLTHAAELTKASEQAEQLAARFRKLSESL